VTTGVCAHCARTKRLDDQDLVPVHYLRSNQARTADALQVAQTGILQGPATGRRRRCPGSGKAPRRVEG
jgi:glutaredoxin